MAVESSSSQQTHSAPDAPGRLWIPSLSGRWCKATHLGYVQNPLQRHSAWDACENPSVQQVWQCFPQRKSQVIRNPMDQELQLSILPKGYKVLKAGVTWTLPLPLWQRDSELSLEHLLAPLTGQSFSVGRWPRSAGKRKLFQHKLHLQGFTFALNICGGPKPPVGHSGFMSVMQPKITCG